MTEHIIVQMEIHSQDWIEEYFAKIHDVVRRHKGAFKVRGGQPERLEGTGKMPDAVFVIEFPDRVHATSFWSCDEFQSLAVLSCSGSTRKAILTDAVK